VGVLGAESSSADADHTAVKVDVRPLETEDFTLTETEGESDDPACGVPPLVGGQQDAPHFLY